MKPTRDNNPVRAFSILRACGGLTAPIRNQPGRPALIKTAGHFLGGMSGSLFLRPDTTGSIKSIPIGYHPFFSPSIARWCNQLHGGEI